jgi:hypothetical protein
VCGTFSFSPNTQQTKERVPEYYSMAASVVSSGVAAVYFHVCGFRKGAKACLPNKMPPDLFLKCPRSVISDIHVPGRDVPELVKGQ